MLSSNSIDESNVGSGINTNVTDNHSDNHGGNIMTKQYTNHLL